MSFRHKKIQLIFPDCDVELKATLFEDKAPVSCKVLWDLLETPMETRVKNTWPGLAELYFLLPEMDDLPFENPIVLATAGDLLFYHFTGPDGKKVFDIGIYYTKGYSEINIGWMPGNGIGKIDENLDGLRIVVARTMIDTYEKMIVRRAE